MGPVKTPESALAPTAERRATLISLSSQWNGWYDEQAQRRSHKPFPRIL